MNVVRRVWLSAAVLALIPAGCGDNGDDSTAELVVLGACDPALSADLGIPSGALVRTPEAADGCHWRVHRSDDDQAALQTAVIQAGAGRTICLDEGTYTLRSELQIATTGLTLRGAGAGKTVLDAATALPGLAAVSIQADSVTLEGLTIKDSPTDGVRARTRHNVALRGVAIEWPSVGGGRHGLVAEACNGVDVDDVAISGARVAAVMISQSFRGRVRASTLTDSAIGIALAASTSVEVTGSTVSKNALGIVILDRPGLAVQGGSRAAVHDNVVSENDRTHPAGTDDWVSALPSGTGVLIVASDKNEVTQNTITHHPSTGLAILFHDPAVFGPVVGEGFDPYPEGNTVHGNTFEGNGAAPRGVLGQLGEATLPPLVDGACAKPSPPEGSQNCLKSNGEAGYLNIDWCGGQAAKSDDAGPVTCDQEPVKILPPCSSAAGCEAPVIKGDALPEDGCTMPFPRLSDYRLFAGEPAEQRPAPGVIAYEVASPLWSDGSLKQRFVRLPPDAFIGFRETGTWLFPQGSILVKTFGYPDGGAAGTLVETRLLIHDSGGWSGHTYVWNAEQTEAFRQVGGVVTDRPYVVPSTITCASCHGNDGEVAPLGPTTRQLNRVVQRDGDAVQQLEWLLEQGAFPFPPPPVASLDAHPDPYGDGSLEDRARGWLDANCGHCHRYGSAAAHTGLSLTAPEKDPYALGVCRPRSVTGEPIDGLDWIIVPGDSKRSLLARRIASTDPRHRMPPLPSLTVDPAGLALIEAWIDSMPAQACDSGGG